MMKIVKMTQKKNLSCKQMNDEQKMNKCSNISNLNKRSADKKTSVKIIQIKHFVERKQMLMSMSLKEIPLEIIARNLP